MKIAFKTGRMYTEHGQRIAAWIDGAHCCFIDFDRGIEEHFPYYPGNLNERELARHVVHMYDHCQYRIEHNPPLREAIRDVRNAGWDAWINSEGVKTLEHFRL